MPRVHHVKKARKDNPVAKAGEPYYWWQFRYGGKRYSATYPRPSQLTQSEYLGQLYSIQESIEDYTLFTREDVESLIDDLEMWKDEIEELGSECEEKRDSMPEQLQDGEVGELLNTRAEACQEMAISFEEVIDSIKVILEGDEDDESEEPAKKEEGEPAKKEAGQDSDEREELTLEQLDSVADLLSSINWDVE